MTDSKQLYQEVILDHNRKPRNWGLLPAATHRAEGHNPLCGDHISVTLEVAGDAVKAISFQGESCAICKASASMMTEALKGQPVAAAHKLFAAVQDLCTGKIEAEQMKVRVNPDMELAVERLASLSGVRQFPVRVKCATLAWHALMSCLEGRDQTTTEK